jgi:hypothetical protein
VIEVGFNPFGDKTSHDKTNHDKTNNKPLAKLGYTQRYRNLHPALLFRQRCIHFFAIHETYLLYLDRLDSEDGPDKTGDRPPSSSA